MKHSHLVSRLASLGLFLVLLFLAGFSIWTAVLNRQATNAFTTSTRLSGLNRQILYALSSEVSVQHEYVLEPGTKLRNEYLAAANTVKALLQRLQKEGDADDQTLARTALVEQAHYLLLTNQFFAAVDANNLTLAHKLYRNDIDPLSDRIQQQVQKEANRDLAEARQAFTQLSQMQNMTFTTTPVVFAIGLLLIGVFWWIIRTYRKTSEANQAEIARLAREASIDPLTGLGNHYAYRECLSHTLEEARSKGNWLVLALFDIDELKIINEEQGHQRGEEILLGCATLLRESRLSDAFFRLGGDDFAMIISQTPPAEATFALQRLCEDAPRHLLGATVSIGIAHNGSGEISLETLQAQATAALHEVKHRGRNRALTFEALGGSVSIVPSAKIQALRQLLSERKMTIAFQPIWGLTSASVFAYEALLRPAAEYGFSGPQEVFDIAEQMGRSQELDAICVEKILARAVELPSDALLFINLTPHAFIYDMLTEAILLEAIVSAGLEPSRVVLEITERSIVNLSEVVQKARSLQRMGLRVALDDAGAGNAGLEMLSQLSLDFVKIDRAVVANALTDQAVRSVFAGITTIARESHIPMVAEGIENAEMLSFVQRAGVQYVQGYLLGRPSETIPEASALQTLSPLMYANLH
jgi:diguanylate cyclase (GGDEF)-like protein